MEPIFDLVLTRPPVDTEEVAEEQLHDQAVAE